MKLFKKLPELFEILVRDRTHDFVQYTNAERTTLAIDFAYVTIKIAVFCVQK